MTADTEDRSESPSLMEPMRLPLQSAQREALADLALELVARSSGLKASLPEDIVAGLAGLVRSMNSYYSNLIEGHYSHPIDIERAMAGDYSQTPEKRDLQIEAVAHVTVQAWMESATAVNPVTTAGLCEIHRRFCEQLPEDLLWVQAPESGGRLRVRPGEFRSHDVRVGRHVAISPGAIPRFVGRFEEAYGGLSTMETILATAAAHHRLLWIHPFSDGNGRVARLMTHGLLTANVDTGGLWSVNRGLARREQEYKQYLMACDEPRHGSHDGRGNLSESALTRFTTFFLETCLDQIRFMEGLIEPDRLHSRVLRWAAHETEQRRLPVGAMRVLEAVLYRGQLPRADVAGLIDKTERQGRRVVHTLVSRGVLTATSQRAPLRLAFPATLAHEWMPGLFPEKNDTP